VVGAIRGEGAPAVALCGGWGPPVVVHDDVVEDGGDRLGRWRLRRAVTSGGGGRGSGGYPRGDGGVR
jgi:hypothetical protein